MVNIISQEQKLSQRGEEEYVGSLKMEDYTLSNQLKCWSVQQIHKALNELRQMKKPIN